MLRLLIGIMGIAMVAGGTDSYRKSIQVWQQHRDAGLRSPDGWLTLVGLFWLKDGDNSIGSATTSDLVLPAGSAPARVGVLKLSGKKIVFVGSNGSARELVPNEDEPEVLRAGSVSFYVIQRGDHFGVRVKDSSSPVLKTFTGMKYFPTDPNLHLRAKFIADPKKIPILNVVGQTELEESPGEVEFSYQGQTHRLRPIFEGKTLFFLFKDATNRSRTYQAGRMLNTPLPVGGEVDLDFNRAYNPPCTFTPYATCPLPPKENTLPFAVTAGELRYGKGHVEYSASR